MREVGTRLQSWQRKQKSDQQEQSGESCGQNDTLPKKKKKSLFDDTNN